MSRMTKYIFDIHPQHPVFFGIIIFCKPDSGFPSLPRASCFLKKKRESLPGPPHRVCAKYQNAAQNSGFRKKG